MVYELIADAGWRDREIDLQEYLAQYSTARYGSCPEPMRAFWREMTQSAYGSFTNNARFNWQQRPVAGRVPTMGINGHYYRAIENFLACDIHSELYRTDAIALAAFYLAAKADDLLDKINWAYVAGNTSEVPAFERQFLNLLAEADCLLESHPVFRLQRWVDPAGRAGQSPEERDRFTGELRRLVTVWGGPHLSDYSARVWSGLIRDYYLPCWEHYFIAKRTGGAFDFGNHDEWYHSARGISHVTPYRDPLASARRLVENAGEISSVNDYRPAGAVAFISPFEHLYERTGSPSPCAMRLPPCGVRFRCTRGTGAATIGSILFRGHRENLSSYEVNRTIAAGEVVEVPIPRQTGPDALPQEVTLQIEVRGHRALDNYMSVRWSMNDGQRASRVFREARFLLIGIADYKWMAAPIAASAASITPSFIVGWAWIVRAIWWAVAPSVRASVGSASISVTDAPTIWAPNRRSSSSKSSLTNPVAVAGCRGLARCGEREASGLVGYAALLRLLFGHADRRHLGLCEDARRDGRIVHRRGIQAADGLHAADGLGQSHVRQRRARHDVADGIDARDVGAVEFGPPRSCRSTAMPSSSRPMRRCWT